MKGFTSEQMHKAVCFIKTQAADIDRAMYDYYFEGRAMEDVLGVLAAYQNEDGGFGRLDYDIDCPVSCLKHTESACRYIYALRDVPTGHPVIQKLIPYLLANYNRETGEWDNLTVPAVNQYPHAPWWGHEDAEPFHPQDREDLLRHYDPNTNAALAGMLVKYPSLVPDDILHEVQAIVVDKIHGGYPMSPYDMMSLLYFMGALKDETLQNGLLKMLMGDGSLLSILDGDWGTENAYKLCLWIDSPEHPYYALYQNAVRTNLDFLVRSQGEDGSWAPSWSWGEPAVWERVSKRLKGLLTVRFLRTLQSFGYIAGIC